MADLNNEAGFVGTLVGYGSGPSDAQSTSGAAASSWAPDTVLQLQSPAFQAAKIGFEVEAWVAPKQSDGKVVLWQISTINDEKGVELTMHGGEVTKNLSVQELIQEWRVHKGKVTTEMPGYSVDVCSPLASESWAMDCIKGAVAIALKAEYEKHEQVAEHLRIMINPYMVYAKKDFAPGKLVLPAASQKVDKKSAAHSIGLGSYEVSQSKRFELFLLQQISAPISKDGKPNKLPWVSAFWAVRCVDQPKQANMKLEYIAVQVLNVTVQVPYLENKCAIAADDELTWCPGKGTPTPPTEKAAKRARR